MIARARRDTAIPTVCTVGESLLFQRPLLQTTRQVEWQPGSIHITSSVRLKTVSKYLTRREKYSAPSGGTDEEASSSFRGADKTPGPFRLGTCTKSAALPRHAISHARGFSSSACREIEPPQPGRALPAKSWVQHQKLDDAVQSKLFFSRTQRSSPSSPISNRQHQPPSTRTRANLRNNQGSQSGTSTNSNTMTEKKVPQKPNPTVLSERLASPKRQPPSEDRPRTKDQPRTKDRPHTKDQPRTKDQSRTKDRHSQIKKHDATSPIGVKSPSASVTSIAPKPRPNTTDLPNVSASKSRETPRGWSFWNLVTGKVSEKMSIKNWLIKRPSFWKFLTGWVSSGNRKSSSPQDSHVSPMPSQKASKKNMKKLDKKCPSDAQVIPEPSEDGEPETARVLRQMPRSFRPIGLLNTGNRLYAESSPPGTGSSAPELKRPFEAAPDRLGELARSYRDFPTLVSDNLRPRAARRIASTKYSAFQGQQTYTCDVFEPLEDKLLLPDEAATGTKSRQHSETLRPSRVDATLILDISLPLTPNVEPVVAEIPDTGAREVGTVVVAHLKPETSGSNITKIIEDTPAPSLPFRSSQSPEPIAVTEREISTSPDLTEDLLLPHEQAAIKGLLRPETRYREQVIKPVEIDENRQGIEVGVHSNAEKQVDLHEPVSLGRRLTGKRSESDVLKDRRRREMGGRLLPAHEYPHVDNYIPSQQQYPISIFDSGSESSRTEKWPSKPASSPTWSHSKFGPKENPGDPRKVISRTRVPTSASSKAPDLTTSDQRGPSILPTAPQGDSDDLVLPYEPAARNVTKNKRTTESLNAARTAQGPNSQTQQPWTSWPSGYESAGDKGMRVQPRQYGDLFTPPEGDKQSADISNGIRGRSENWQGGRNVFGHSRIKSNDTTRDLFGEADFWGKSSESRLVDISFRAVGMSPRTVGDAVQISESRSTRQVARRRSNIEALPEKSAWRPRGPTSPSAPRQSVLKSPEGAEQLGDGFLENFWERAGNVSRKTAVQDKNVAWEAPVSPGWSVSAIKNEKDPYTTERDGWQSIAWEQMDKSEHLSRKTEISKPFDSHAQVPEHTTRVIDTADAVDVAASPAVMAYPEPEYQGGVYVEEKRERGRERQREGRGSRYVDIDQDGRDYESGKGVKRRDRVSEHENSRNRDQGRGKRRAESGPDEDWEDEWEQHQARKRVRMQQREQAELEQSMAGPPQITIPEFIAVEDLARALHLSADELARALVEFGFENLTVKSVLTGETAALIAQEYGFEAKVEEGENRDLKSRSPPEDPSTIPERPPIVTIMGHVDHGKTTMLDYLRKSSVAAQEHGGITQHIGAFVVQMSTGKQITFLDTPGHEAFLAMRQRGAFATDIVVLVVAADDSVKPQTIEALNHAKAAKVPIIVAINKIDKPGARADVVKLDLGRHDIEIEDFDGDVPVVCTSGKTGEGMAQLEETILTLSEVLDIRAEKDGMAEGWVIEASIKVVGKSAVVLVKRGTLRTGDIIVAGTSWARIRMLRNELGEEINEAPPGTPAEVLGWSDSLPDAGDEVIEAPDEGKARTAVTYREEMKERGRNVDEVARQEQVRREEMARREELANETQEPSGNNGDVGSSPKQIAFIIKADVAGSAEAVASAILQIGNHEVQPKVLRSAAGAISEWDVEHAAVSGSIVVSFNMPIAPAIRTLADRDGVIIIEHSVIYRLIDDVKERLSVHLADKITHRVKGEAEVLQIFPINIKGKVFRNFAGCRIRNGSVTIGSLVRVLRRGQNIHESKVDSMRHGRKEVNEMFKNSECGIGVAGFEEFVEGDMIQIFEELRETRRL